MTRSVKLAPLMLAALGLLVLAPPASATPVSPAIAYTIRDAESDGIGDGASLWTDSSGFFGLVSSPDASPILPNFTDETFVEFSLGDALDAGVEILRLQVSTLFSTPTSAPIEFQVAHLPGTGTADLANFGAGTPLATLTIPQGTTDASPLVFDLALGDILGTTQATGAQFVAFRVFGPTRIPDIGTGRQIRYAGATLVVPEPATGLLVSLGIVAVAAGRRRHYA